MKRNLLSASAIALMALLAASCAKNDIFPGDGNDVNNSNQIAFRTSTGKTRANDNSLPEVKTGFHVIALTKAKAYVNGFADPLDENVTYSFNTTVIPNAWDWKDAASKADKIWPTTPGDYPLTFLAAYPANPAIKLGATTMTENVTPNIADVGFIYNTYSEGNVNTITATALTIDKLSALSVVAGCPVTGFADLTFKHIMSAVAFDVLVPTGFTAEIQSIKIANINKSGRKYDYATQVWTTETAYDENTHAHFAHCNSVTTPQSITSGAATVNGFTDAVLGFNTLKLMPQTDVAEWALGTDALEANSFKKDADAWVKKYPTVNATAIEAWHKNETTSDNGMKNSEGWKGARIEVIYRLIDNNGKIVIGQKVDVFNTAGIEGTANHFVRVGYILDLAALDVKGDGTLFGFQPGYRYTFQIPLGMAGATNGILLDPDYKNENGNSTDEPVDNPKVNPGDPVTGGGLINFNVTVEDWIPGSGVIN